MPGHHGSYRGVVVDVADPVERHRVEVQVPDVLGSDTAWAAPEEPTAAVPDVGAEVTVRFENGDETQPLWSPGPPPSGDDRATGRFPDTYRGVVVANDDPMQLRRVAVHVPDVAPDSTSWAAPEHPDAPLPAVGDEVFVRFENGDPDHPLWSGGSGGGEAGQFVGTHRATVLSTLDPEGLGRLYLQVPGVSDGLWAQPEQRPPGVGEEVTVRFDGGPDSARWTR